MNVAINQQRKIWQQMPNLVHEWRRDYSISKSLKSNAIQNAKGTSSSFIVDWQLSDACKNAVQLSFFF